MCIFSRQRIAALMIGALATASLFAPAATVRAQTFNVTTDFSFTNNPNGVWLYAFASDLGGTLTALDTPFGSAGNPRGWQSSLINSLGTPAVYRNDSAGSVNGNPPGFVAVHPSFDGSIADFAVIRFTTPTTGIYTISAQFFAGDSGNTDVTILRNASVGSPLFSAATTNTNPLYTNNALSLISGDFVDFYVGTGGDNYFSDTTPVAITLTRNVTAAAPEPNALALMLPAAALGGIVRRRLGRRKG